jgi:hypothetical protein
MFATTTPRNDASSAVGQWDLQGAYKYFSEANAGYHFNVNHGLNVDLGIFVSYIGLFSYNFDNWTYQPSFVSSNTPCFRSLRRSASRAAMRRAWDSRVACSFFSSSVSS